MQEITDLSSAENYLNGLVNLERSNLKPRPRLSLSPITHLLEHIGNPHFAFQVLHIAGSKGKGSTALFAESLLLSAGVKVGTYTSPHLQQWTERYRIGGREVEGKALFEEVLRLQPHVESLRGTLMQPTFFDVSTALAFSLFKRFSVTHAIVEVGLGGRLDSTNVVNARVSCVTSIELEHTEILGNTLEEIASEKAGIIKNSSPVVVGDLSIAPQKIVLERAQSQNAESFVLGSDFGIDFSTTPLTIYDGSFKIPFRTKLLGSIAPKNAAIALACVRRFPDISICKPQAAKALSTTELPGRLEIVSNSPTVLVDSAHTPESAKFAREALDRFDSQVRWMIVSFSNGKNIKQLIELLLPGSSRIIVTIANEQRSIDPEELCLEAERVVDAEDIEVILDPEEALRLALTQASPRDLICVMGSVYLAGRAKKYFENLK